jgi:hypothetical protein
MTPEVTAAIQELKETFPSSPMTIREDGQGGAYVIMEKILLGNPYLQPETWVGFHLSFQYPYADVYPHFVRPDLTRTDACPLGEAMSPSSFENRKAVQVSRRSKRLNPATDTAALKLLKVLDWMKSR